MPGVGSCLCRRSLSPVAVMLTSSATEASKRVSKGTPLLVLKKALLPPASTFGMVAFNPLFRILWHFFATLQNCKEQKGRLQQCLTQLFALNDHTDCSSIAHKLYNISVTIVHCCHSCLCEVGIYGFEAKVVLPNFCWKESQAQAVCSRLISWESDPCKAHSPTIGPTVLMKSANKGGGAPPPPPHPPPPTLLVFFNESFQFSERHRTFFLFYSTA
jgi:hypothetical protein